MAQGNGEVFCRGDYGRTGIDGLNRLQNFARMCIIVCV